MPGIWQRVRQLRGRTLCTLTTGSQFVIEDTGDDFVAVAPQTGKRRRILRTEIEKVAAVSTNPDILRKTAARELPGNQCTSYIAAIIREVTKPA